MCVRARVCYISKSLKNYMCVKVMMCTFTSNTFKSGKLAPPMWIFIYVKVFSLQPKENFKFINYIGYPFYCLLTYFLTVIVIYL